MTILGVAAQIEKVSSTAWGNPSSHENADWSWGCVAAVDFHGRTIFVADAHRGDDKRFIVHPDEKLTAFVELESTTRASYPSSFATIKNDLAGAFETATRRPGRKKHGAFVMTPVSRTRERTPRVFTMEHGRDCVLRPEPRWSLHLDPCDTKNGSARNKQVRATQTGNFNFCGAMCVPLKHTKNDGSVISYRPSQPSINSRLAKLLC